LVWASKLSGLRFVGCATKPSRFSDLLRVEASQARLSQFDHKTDRGATVGGARGTIVEVV
jgi:hypothetical protein